MFLVILHLITSYSQKKLVYVKLNESKFKFYEKVAIVGIILVLVKIELYWYWYRFFFISSKIFHHE